eukprot:GFYU01018733.1.p1 GENE.GFYU01018733.1~~GFYU01018733.1.p1  ORF type:complete len:666 (-),score=108.58 GFYU01018733.1:96-2093(-)
MGDFRFMTSYQASFLNPVGGGGVKPNRRYEEDVRRSLPVTTSEKRNYGGGYDNPYDSYGSSRDTTRQRTSGDMPPWLPDNDESAATNRSRQAAEADKKNMYLLELEDQMNANKERKRREREERLETDYQMLADAQHFEPTGLPSAGRSPSRGRDSHRYPSDYEDSRYNNNSHSRSRSPRRVRLREHPTVYSDSEYYPSAGDSSARRRGGAMTNRRQPVESRRYAGYESSGDEGYNSDAAAKKQQYRDELSQQIEENRRRKDYDKRRMKEIEAREEAEMMSYNPWGREGGGAPLKKHVDQAYSSPTPTSSYSAPVSPRRRRERQQDDTRDSSKYHALKAGKGGFFFESEEEAKRKLNQRNQLAATLQAQVEQKEREKREKLEREKEAERREEERIKRELSEMRRSYEIETKGHASPEAAEDVAPTVRVVSSRQSQRRPRVTMDDSAPAPRRAEPNPMDQRLMQEVKSLKDTFESQRRSLQDRLSQQEEQLGALLSQTRTLTTARQSEHAELVGLRKALEREINESRHELEDLRKPKFGRRAQFATTPGIADLDYFTGSTGVAGDLMGGNADSTALYGSGGYGTNPFSYKDRNTDTDLLRPLDASTEMVYPSDSVAHAASGMNRGGAESIDVLADKSEKRLASLAHLEQSGVTNDSLQKFIGEVKST